MSTPTPRPRVLLVTFQILPEGETGGARLVDALAERGVDAAWAVWDDPAVDWAAADLVAVRSTWDYHRRLPEFLEWARRTADVTRVLNGGRRTFAWNADKTYLTALGEHVPVVPTLPVDDATLLPVLADALERWGTVVVKPRTGAGGVGVVVLDGLRDDRLEGLVAGPWVAQPLVGSVRTEGEVSVFVLGGRAVAQVDKLPAAGEIRVHELYGGRSRPVPVGDETGSVALAAVDAAESLLEDGIDYARVDLMRWDGVWAVSELELIEPGLYLDVAPELAGLFADLVPSRLR